MLPRQVFFYFNAQITGFVPDNGPNQISAGAEIQQAREKPLLPGSKYVQQFDRPLEREARAESEGHVLRDVRGDSKLVRVFRLARAGKQGRLDALAGMVRTVGSAEWALVYSSPPSIVLRGTAQELELGSLLLGELDRGPGEGAASASEFKLQEKGTAFAVRVMLLRAMPDEELRQAEEEMRKAGKAWVALDAELPALVVKGWPELMEAGQQRLRERGWLR